jgi:acetyl-CoA C-acetyltransferase
MNASARRVAVLGGSRIPFARQHGPYASASNQDMLTATLDSLVTKFGLEGEVMGEVAAGAVLKHSRDFNLTRESVLGSRLAPETPAYDVQQACGTGLEATILVANKIALGQIECGIAGGVDITSDAPIAVNEDLREVLLELNRAKSNAGRPRTLTKLRPQQIVPEIPRNSEPRTGLSNLRADSSVEKLAKLRPAFGGPEGTMTAGNSKPRLSDGASTVLLASEEWAAAHDIPVQAFFTEAQTAGVDYVHKREGLLMAPAYALPRMLSRADRRLQDFDFYEPRSPAGRDRPRSPQRPRRLAGSRTPLRRHRRADRRRPGQGPARAQTGPARPGA